MSTALDRAITRRQRVVIDAERSLQNRDMDDISMRAFGADMQGLLSTNQSAALFGTSQEQLPNRERYKQYRGWLYSALHTLCAEGASQGVNVATMRPRESQGERRTIREQKAWNQRQRAAKSYRIPRMPKSLRRKAVEAEFEIQFDHPLYDVLEAPNPIQSGWQFAYNFIANIGLTGWSFVVGGVNKEGKMQLYSLPTTWITPVHKDGPFSAFVIRNPNKVGAKPVTLPRENVGFAHLPNPADPMSALAPAASQIRAIRVDDHIQTSQEAFYHNGIFPSAIISIGRDPHPHVPGGLRPRLTGRQRRQVIRAIQAQMSHVSQFGTPAIVDGLIEKIERLSMASTEMGWDKSEGKIRARILSAYGVPPYLLGESTVGSYAQAYITQDLFCKRVNTYLTMLNQVISNFVNYHMQGEGGERVVVWWDECEAHDPSLYWANMREGRKNSDIFRNEFRAAMGLPPVDDDEDTRNKLLESPQGLQQAVQALAQVGKGTIRHEQLVELFKVAFHLDDGVAESIVGSEQDEDDDPAVLPMPVSDDDNAEDMGEAMRQLREAVRALRGSANIEGEVERILSGVEE